MDQVPDVAVQLLLLPARGEVCPEICRHFARGAAVEGLSGKAGSGSSDRLPLRAEESSRAGDERQERANGDHSNHCSEFALRRWRNCLVGHLSLRPLPDSSEPAVHLWWSDRRKQQRVSVGQFTGCSRELVRWTIRNRTHCEWIVNTGVFVNYRTSNSTSILNTADHHDSQLSCDNSSHANRRRAEGFQS
jgi:hypothetical protein